jgi:hypothetical protein
VPQCFETDPSGPDRHVPPDTSRRQDIGSDGPSRLRPLDAVTALRFRSLRSSIQSMPSLISCGYASPENADQSS